MASWRDSQFEHWAGQGGGNALQMAVMTSAIANGGKVFWPRLVAGWETLDPDSVSNLSPRPKAACELN